MVHSAPFGTYPAVGFHPRLDAAGDAARPAWRLMARLTLALIIGALILLQAVILPGIEAFHILPNLVMVLILCWAALRGPGEGAIWAFSVGLVFDAIGLDPIGSNGLALLAVVLLGVAAGQRFFSSSVLLPVPVTIIATFAYGLILLILRAGSGEGIPIGSLFLLLILQALLNSLMVLVLYPIARRVDARVIETRR
jgi:rod shape-determining protein MreD